MNTKTDLSQYIVNVQGKDFITFPGLLAEAHAQGLQSIQTELVNTDLKNPVVKATVILLVDGKTTKTFTGYGDANADNVAKKVVGALLRMAETRSIARALRFACNIDMAALEELSSDDDVINHQKPQTVAPKTGFNKPAPTPVVKAAEVAPVIKTQSTIPEPSLSQALSGLKKPEPVGPAVEANEAGPAVAKPSFGRRTTLSKSPDPKF